MEVDHSPILISTGSLAPRCSDAELVDDFLIGKLVKVEIELSNGVKGGRRLQADDPVGMFSQLSQAVRSAHRNCQDDRFRITPP